MGYAPNGPRWATAVQQERVEFGRRALKELQMGHSVGRLEIGAVPVLRTISLIPQEAGFAMETTIFLLVLASLFGAAVAGILAAPMIPQNHLSAASKDVIYAIMNVVALLSAVVLGLLTLSAKDSFDTRDREWRQALADIVLLDRTLAEYGPESAATRELLQSAVKMKQAQIKGLSIRIAEKPTTSLIVGIEQVQRSLLGLTPSTEAQRLVKERAIDISVDIAKARWFLLEDSDSTVPIPFLLVLVSWLVIIFFSYGLFAERNFTVIMIFFFSAISLAASIYLILDMDDSLGGPIAISMAPLSRTLDQLGQ